MLMGLVSFFPAAHAAQGESALEDGLADEVLPGGPAADTPDTMFPTPPAAPAPLPSLTVLRGVCSVNLRASGLLDYLAPFLAQETGIVIQWLAVDDKRALALAREGGSDLLLTAMPDKEKALVREGRAEQRLELMRDGYVLAGPAADPAAIRNKNILEALRAIAAAGAPFVSRGDGSAPHKRERALWKNAERPVRDARNGYVECGQGFPATLALADASGAYVLTDKATLLTYQAAHGDSLAVLVEDQAPLSRIWSLVSLTPAADREAGKENAAARALRALAVRSLVEWWQKPSTRDLTARFTREGQPVFTPLPVQMEPPAEASSAPSSFLHKPVS